MAREIYISTDIETDGPIPGPHSMLSLASAAYLEDKTLVSTWSANMAPQVLVDDPIRVLPVKSLDEPISVQVKISNAGGAPLSLQIERAIPGCERAELSASTLAPGASATLTLSLRWRSVLKSPTQNVVAFMATNDPRRPRLPLGFTLDNRRTAWSPGRSAGKCAGLAELRASALGRLEGGSPGGGRGH